MVLAMVLVLVLELEWAMELCQEEILSKGENKKSNYALKVFKEHENVVSNELIWVKLKRLRYLFEPSFSSNSSKPKP